MRIIGCILLQSCTARYSALDTLWLTLCDSGVPDSLCLYVDTDYVADLAMLPSLTASHSPRSVKPRFRSLLSKSLFVLLTLGGQYFYTIVHYVTPSNSLRSPASRHLVLNTR